MQRKFFNVLVSLTMLTAIAPVFADDAKGGATINTTEIASKKGHGKFNSLGLSDEQKSTISALKSKFKESAAPKREELQAHRKSIQDLLSQSVLDKDKIMAEQDKVNALSAELATAKLAFRIDSNQALTPEQRQKLHDKIGKMRAGRGKHHGHRRQADQAPAQS